MLTLNRIQSRSGKQIVFFVFFPRGSFVGSEKKQFVFLILIEYDLMLTYFGIIKMIRINILRNVSIWAIIIAFNASKFI